jgi:hypothetical protein
VAVAAAAVVLASVTPGEAKNDRTRFRCKAETATSQMSAEYESRTMPKAKRSFRAQFEGDAGGTLVAGAQLAVVVDSVTVGTITLVQEVLGEVEGQLRFDLKGRFGKKVLPFPATFPVIAAGSSVELQLAGTPLLACELN